MFKLVRPLPKEVYVAVSGGADSMAALHFLHRGRKVKAVLHVNHGTGRFADLAEQFVREIATRRYDLPVVVKKVSESPLSGSLEEFWRDERYAFFHSFDPMPVVVAHTLDDCVEEYIMNTMVRGRLGTIPYNNRNCIRPFRTWEKKDILKYCARNGIKYFDDPSNSNTRFKRNLIRHKIAPEIRKLNPGITKIVRDMVLNRP